MDPLVSIVVATYNSSQFVTESLDSVEQQTWTNIELIITDDCSGDNTVEVCKNWVQLYDRRFIKTEILVSSQNTGIPANLNRGLRQAKGEWVHFLAGDDALKPNFVEDNMNWIKSNDKIKVLFSLVEVYSETFLEENLIKIIPGNPYCSESIMAPDRSARSQYKMLLLSDRIHYTPSLFINRETLNTLGEFDERFAYLEDYPLWLKLTGNNYRLYIMDKITVKYRQHHKAINNTGLKYLININYFKQERFRRLYIYPNLPRLLMLNQRFYWYASRIFQFDFFNRDNKLNRFLLHLLTVLLNPFKYVILLKKLTNKELKNDELYGS